MMIADGWACYFGADGPGYKLEIDFGDGWESVSEWVAGMVRQSGRRQPLDRFQASTLTVDLDNRDRRFSPWYDGATFGRPRRNQRIRLTGRTGTGLEVVRFVGGIDSWREVAVNSGARPSTIAVSRVQVKAADDFKRLARANGLGTTPAGDGELTGARVTRILDAAGYTGDRFIDDGEATLAETDLSRPALDELHDVALSEGGVFFISGPGVATFFDRASITSSLDPVVRFGNDGGDGSIPYGEITIADTDEAIINTVRIARAGGTEYTAVDSGGVDFDGPILFSRTDLPLETDDQAEALAAVLLSRAVNASFVVGPIEIHPITGGAPVWAAAVSLGVTNPVSVAHGDIDIDAGFTLLARIDGIVDRIGPGVWATQYTVSALDEPDSYEVIGPPYDLTAETSYTSIEWGWTNPLHGFDTLFVQLDSLGWVPIPGDAVTYWTGGLDPASTHTFQIRGRKGLVDTGIVTLTASTAAAPTGPDPDDDGDSTIPDPPDDCAETKGWAWRLEELSSTMGVTLLDDGLWTTLLPSTWRPEWEYEPLTWYRLTWQMYCDGAPEGDSIVYDWQEPADWGDPCTFGTPPDPAPVFDLEVCPSTGSIQDAVTNFPMVERELYISPRPGPLETDTAALCGPGFIPAPVASGYLVDAAPLGVQIPPVLNPAMTIGLWVNFDSEPAADCPLVTIGADAEIELRAIADTVDVGTVRFVVSIKHPGGSGTLYTFDAAADHDDEVPIAGWHTAAFTWGWEGSEANLRLYIDGLPTGTVHPLTGDWTVRAHDALVVWGGEPNSSFAHPCAWDDVLSAAEIADIFTPPAEALTYDETVLEDEPDAFWPFAELDGVNNRFDDVSGNAQHLTVTTEGDWTEHTADLPNGDNAFSLSTTLKDNAHILSTSYFSLTNSGGSEAITFEAWVKVDTSTNGKAICAVKTNEDSDAGGRRHWNVILAGRKIVCRWHDTSTGEYLIATSPSDLSVGWHHVVAIIHHGSTRSINVYVDGTLDCSDTTTAGSPTYNTTFTYSLFVGTNRSDAITEMNVPMSKPAFYKKALGTDRITAHYDAMYA